MGSIDADSMFTKMNMEMAAKQVAMEYMESNLKMENVDYCKAQVYIASALTRKQVVSCGIARWIPRRKSSQGTKPGVTTSEITTRRPRSKKTLEGSIARPHLNKDHQLHHHHQEGGKPEDRRAMCKEEQGWLGDGESQHAPPPVNQPPPR